MKWGQKAVDRREDRNTINQAIKNNLAPAGQIGSQAQMQMDRIEAKLDKLLQQQTKSRTL